MKTINQKLLATSGLFVAFCALTSFNPFSQANHLSQLHNKEESISLAASSVTPSPVPPAGRAGVRHAADNAETRKQSSALAERINAGKPEQTLEEKARANAEADKARGAQSQDREGTVCADGKCDETPRNSATADIEAILEKVEKNERLSAEEISALRDSRNHNEDSSEDEELDAGLCLDGDYMDRILCYKKKNSDLSKRRSRATSEARGIFKDEMEEFIVEIVTDDSLDTREKTRYLNRIARIVKTDRSLSNDIRIALQSLNASRNEEVFARRVEARTAEIQAIDNQIRQINASGMAQYSQFQLDQLYTMRKSLVYGLEEEVRSYRESVAVSLPQARVGSEESALVAHLRAERTASYQNLVAPIAGGLTDKSLLSLDTNLAGSPVLAAAPTTGSGPQPYYSASNSGLNPGGLNTGLNSYNPANPLAGITGMQGSGPIPYSQWLATRGQNYGTAGYAPNQYAMNNNGMPATYGRPRM